MRRERLARLALRAYPSAEDAARADEMLATLLDASAGSRRRFLREVGDVVRLGLHARATNTASAGAPRLVADGFCLAGVWLMALDLTALLSWRYRGLHDPLLGWPSIALSAAVLALALIRLDRLAGAGALGWTALRLPALLHHHPGIAGLAAEALPTLCFAVMVVAPRRRALALSGLAWLVVPVVLVATCGPPGGERNPLLLGAVVLAVTLVFAFALAMLPTDPRMAIAGAVGLSDLAVDLVAINHDTSALAGLSLAAAPAAVAIAVARTRHLRRQAVANRYVV
jgi:hypothetical protein